MKLKSLPRQLGYILGAQWTRDLSWTIFTILLARRSPEMLGQIAVALSCGYLVKTVSDVGLNDFLLSTFARREERPRTLLGEVTGLKTCFMMLALIVTWFVTGWLGYSFELRLIVLFIATGFGLDGVTFSFLIFLPHEGRNIIIKMRSIARLFFKFIPDYSKFERTSAISPIIFVGVTPCMEYFFSMLSPQSPCTYTPAIVADCKLID